MPGIEDPAPPPAAPVQTPQALGFSVLHQTVELDIDIPSRSLKGRTTILVSPHSRELSKIRLNCRQCDVLDVTIDQKKCRTIEYRDPFEQLVVSKQRNVHHAQYIHDKIAGTLKSPPDEELVITVPKTVKIQEINRFDENFRAAPSAAVGSAGSVSAVNGVGSWNTGKNSAYPDSALPLKTADLSAAKFDPLTLVIEYKIYYIRDGLQFVGVDGDDGRYPHAFTRSTAYISSACCLFPCVDNLASRCTWDITIKCHRTLGDVIKNRPTDRGVSGRPTNNKAYSENASPSSLSEEDRELEVTVICSGDLTDEIVDRDDPTKKSLSFSVSSPLAPQQIGFVVGPFEYVNLAEYRESDEDDILGQNAIPVYGFCLPGRSDDLRNTCLPVAKAIDFFTRSYGSFPFPSFKICFIDDLAAETVDTASLCLCSNRLLYPEEIIDPIYDTTRQLIHGLAAQWIGVNIIPKEATDTWIVVGIAYFITDMFMKHLCGNNEYRYRQRKAAEQVCELDYARPSLSVIGQWISLDPSELEFMALKAPLVLFILDRRLTKASGMTGMPRIVSRVFLNAKTGDLPNAAVSSQYFGRTCEKLGHTKLDTFFAQWVNGAGCPRFRVTQRFNKKKLVVEMMIQQVQMDMPTSRDLVKENFMRDVREDNRTIYAAPLQGVFTGPMTIRIHEADGTPYEHIVEIKEQLTKFDIPYNTKYKRLKRSRRAKERVITSQGIDGAGEGQEDELLYCLGDVLQSEAEIQDWQLAEWSKEDEERMSQESYEWIRMDSDFEWICTMTLQMPGYMYTSQLQQDRDVVAQYESIQYMANQNPHPLVSTILVRTLMDKRYFHGIRTAAAQAIVKHAKEEVGWIGLHHLKKAFDELYCIQNSPMTKSNDFSDRASYMIQCELPQLIAQVKGNNGKTPMSVKQWLYDKIKFNDNSNNDYSDCYYVSGLIRSLARCLSPRAQHSSGDIDFDMDIDDYDDGHFDKECLAEIERYRRMDEWTPSYQNIYSRTVLDCQRELMQRDVMDIDFARFLSYTRPGTLDILRVNAFNNLVELDILAYPKIVSWFLFMLSSDPSTYIRDSLRQLFGKALANVAFGEKAEVRPAGSLIIERDAGTDSRANDLARRQTIEGAINAMRDELRDFDEFKMALWAAVKSDRLGLFELDELLEICKTLYNKEEHLVIPLYYPRYWAVEYLGKGVLKFKKTPRVRTALTPVWSRLKDVRGEDRAISESSHGADAVKPPLKIKFARTHSNVNMMEAATRGSPASPAPAAIHQKTLLKPPKRPAEEPAEELRRRLDAPAGHSPSSVPALTTNGDAPKRPQLKLKLNIKGSQAFSSTK